jgi:DNA-binding transcriptional LysR family regulator
MLLWTLLLCKESHTLAELEWSLLHSFLAVARAGRLTTAAHALGLNHSTLSRRIATLESALQTRLFDRSATGYVLTAPGERLLSHARDVESTILRLQAEIAGASHRIEGTVRIGAPEGFGTFFLAPILPRLAAAHPDLEIQLVTLPRIFSLSKREADLAIGLACPEEGRLHARKLTDYELGLYASTPYLADHPAPTTLEALQHHRLIGYISDLIYTRELDYLPLMAPNLRPTFTSSNLIAQLAAVRAGHGLCVLPCFIGQSEPTLHRVLSHQISLTRSFWLTVHADMRTQARVAVTADFIGHAVRSARLKFLPQEAKV